MSSNEQQYNNYQKKNSTITHEWNVCTEYYVSAILCISFHGARLLPLVLASDEQDDVEERPEEEAERGCDEEAHPLAEVRDGLLREHVGAGDDAAKHFNKLIIET